MAYQPASTTTVSPGLNHLATVYYERTALDNLKQSLVMMQVTEPDDIPRRNGKTIQFYRYATMAANTTPSAEGTVGSGISPSTNTVSATVSQYSDFMTLSDLLVDTAIDPVVENSARELGYRAALSVDTIVRVELESNTGGDLAPVSGGAASVADLRAAVAHLKANNVQPRQGGDYVTVCHPYICHDIRADNTSGGFIDYMKYTEGNVGRLMNAEVGKVEGTRVIETTNVGTSGTAPTVSYAAYTVGMGAIGAVSLAGRGPSTPPMNPRGSQAFRVNIIPGRPQIADPEGKIGAAISYNFVFVAVLLAEGDTDLRYRTLNADATLV